MSSDSRAETFKAEGNQFFAQGKFPEAIRSFSEAIVLDANNAVLYSNRSAAYASLKQWDEAIEDAKKTVELKPDWGKGWNRLATAHLGVNDFKSAKDAFEAGLKVDPTNSQLLKGLESIKEAGNAGPSPREFPNPFTNPKVEALLQASPKTAAYFSEPDFVAKLAEMKRDPQSVSKHLQDERVMDALAVLLNIDSTAQASQRPASKAQEVPSPAPTKPANKPDPVQTSTSVVSAEEQAAIKLKDLGTEAYKKKDFATAMKYYEDAFSLTPNNPTLLLNQSAVLFEKGDYDGCVTKSNEAIELARSLEKPVDYTFYGKAYARIASAYVKLDNLDEAIKFYNKSLTENRSADTLAKLRETEKL